ncbi:MAG TPA: hypothetical protein VM620_11285 [Hyphomicrobium sp.]|jgi:hypothetical protein|nr:hypothetical protein [Hyphomicrobium sp.]
MGSIDYKDLKQPYDKTQQTTRMLASNAAFGSTAGRRSLFGPAE